MMKPAASTTINASTDRLMSDLVNAASGSPWRTRWHRRGAAVHEDDVCEITHGRIAHPGQASTSAATRSRC